MKSQQVRKRGLIQSHSYTPKMLNHRLDLCRNGQFELLGT